MLIFYYLLLDICISVFAILNVCCQIMFNFFFVRIALSLKQKNTIIDTILRLYYANLFKCFHFYLFLSFCTSFSGSIISCFYLFFTFLPIDFKILMTFCGCIYVYVHIHQLVYMHFEIHRKIRSHMLKM